MPHQPVRLLIRPSPSVILRVASAAVACVIAVAAVGIGAVVAVVAADLHPSRLSSSPRAGCFAATGDNHVITAMASDYYVGKIAETSRSDDRLTFFHGYDQDKGAPPSAATCLQRRSERRYLRRRPGERIPT